MKKFILMLLLALVATVTVTTTTSCGHRHHHNDVDEWVYTQEDTAFVVSLASSLMCNEFDNIDDYMFYHQLHKRVEDAKDIVNSLPEAKLERLAKISLKEYGRVDDISIAELVTNETLIKYLTDDGVIDPDRPEVADSNDYEASTTQEFSKLKGGGK